MNVCQNEGMQASIERYKSRTSLASESSILLSAARRAASGMQLTLTDGMALRAKGSHTSSYMLV